MIKLKKIKKRELGFGLVGTGTIAPKHIKGINMNKDAKLVGVFSNSFSRGKDFAKKFNIKHYVNYSDMLNDKNIDVIDIITYNHLHAKYATQAINHNKHVIVEKPIDTNLNRAKKLVRLAKKKQKKLSCVSQLRFSPGIIKIKNLIDRGIMGDIFLLNISIPFHKNEKYYLKSKWKCKKRTAGGGILIMNVIHIIDILLWLFGPIKNVSGKKRIIRKKITNVEDCICTILEFKNNILGVISATNATAKGGPIRIEIHGTKKSITLENFMIANKLYKRIIPQFSSKDYFYFQIKDMINSIKYNREPLVNGESAIEALKVVNLIYQSFEKKD